MLHLTMQTLSLTTNFAPTVNRFIFFFVCLAETRTEIFNEPVEDFFFKNIKFKVETPALQRA